ncbi:MAG: hypothetical protein MZU95_10765 [Desulfomicrobium escambiense]|nr:hypothetical protein [Desulfomicrobium escambiense]
MGLGCLEVTFTYGVRMKEPRRPRRWARSHGENDIALSVHAPYYINLAAGRPGQARREPGAHSGRLPDGGADGRPQRGLSRRVLPGAARPRRPSRGSPAAIETLQAEALRKPLGDRAVPRDDRQAVAVRVAGGVPAAGARDRLRVTRWTSRTCWRGRAGDSRLRRGPGPAPAAAFTRTSRASNTAPRASGGTSRRPPTFFRPLAKALAGRRLEATLVCESPRPYPDAAMMRRVLDGPRAPAPGSRSRQPASGGAREQRHELLRQCSVLQARSCAP